MIQPLNNITGNAKLTNFFAFIITNTPLFVKFSANKLTYLTNKFPKNNLLECTTHRFPVYS
ncbi:hypothetical protein F8163_15150 [Bacillus luti]|uniref:Uncharacterized protein n=1 Tax=Bacillus luti TaxID=2026191 RepID=A0A7V7S9P0_9BACI|nr:hypothetical protein F8163_15150 [Bacillus luti]